MKKKIVMLFMLSFMVISLCACGEKAKEAEQKEEMTGELIPEGAVYSRIVGTEDTVNGPVNKRKEYVGNGKDVYFPNGVKDDDRFTMGDYEYVYTKEYITFEDKTYAGWYGQPIEDKATYETALASINGEPVIGLNIGNELMTETPILPDSILFMHYTFQGCTNLKVVSNIPSSVISMMGAFSRCTSLTQVPDIPEGVLNIAATFEGCTSLTTAPSIPSSVKNMGRTFAECTNLTGAVEIDATPEYYEDCFEYIHNPIIIKGECAVKEELAQQDWSGHITVE